MSRCLAGGIAIESFLSAPVCSCQRLDNLGTATRGRSHWELTMKMCSKCGETKKGSSFNKGHNQCKVCQAIYARQYRSAHLGEIAAYKRQFYWAHHEELCAYMRQYGKAHPEAICAYAARRRALERGAQGYNYTTSDMVLARWGMWGNHCWICGNDAEETDHVKPLAKGGAHWPCNLRPICRACNLNKNAKWPYPIKVQR